MQKSSHELPRSPVFLVPSGGKKSVVEREMFSGRRSIPHPSTRSPLFCTPLPFSPLSARKNPRRKSRRTKFHLPPSFLPFSLTVRKFRIVSRYYSKLGILRGLGTWTRYFERADCLGNFRRYSARNGEVSLSGGRQSDSMVRENYAIVLLLFAKELCWKNSLFFALRRMSRESRVCKERFTREYPFLTQQLNELT